MKGIIIFFLLCAVLVSSPVYAAKKDKIMADQMQRIEDSIKILDERLVSLSTEVGNMAKSITQIEERLTKIAMSQADGNQNKENLTLNLQFIREALNELKDNVNKINDRLVSIPPSGLSTDNTSETSTESRQEQTSQSPETAYYAAYSDYIKKNYPLAVEGFKQFIKGYPKHDLADNALYWIGECYYSQKLFKDAVNTFTNLIETYPDGDKLPDAILKKGYSLIELGKPTEGISTLKELISRFPLSEEASLAQQRIKEVSE